MNNFEGDNQLSESNLSPLELIEQVKANPKLMTPEFILRYENVCTNDIDMTRLFNNFRNWLPIGNSGRRQRKLEEAKKKKNITTKSLTLEQYLLKGHSEKFATNSVSESLAEADKIFWESIDQVYQEDPSITHEFITEKFIEGGEYKNFSKLIEFKRAEIVELLGISESDEQDVYLNDIIHDLQRVTLEDRKKILKVVTLFYRKLRKAGYTHIDLVS